MQCLVLLDYEYAILNVNIFVFPSVDVVIILFSCDESSDESSSSSDTGTSYNLIHSNSENLI